MAHGGSSQEYVAQLLPHLQSLPMFLSRPMEELTEVVWSCRWGGPVPDVFSLRVLLDGVTGCLDGPQDAIVSARRNCNALLFIMANHLFGQFGTSPTGVDVLRIGYVAVPRPVPVGTGMTIFDRYDTVTRYPPAFKGLFLRIRRMVVDVGHRRAILDCLRNRFFDGPVPHTFYNTHSQWLNDDRIQELSNESISTLLRVTREQVRVPSRDCAEWEGLGKPVLRGRGLRRLVQLVVDDGQAPSDLLLRVITSALVYADTSAAAKAEVVALATVHLLRMFENAQLFTRDILLIPFCRQLYL